MSSTLVDTSVLLDLLDADSEWHDWSAWMLSRCGSRSSLAINPIIFAEVSAGFVSVEDVEEALPKTYSRREPLPWDAAFLAGQAFVRCRNRGGTKPTPLPDFYIGAHAAVARYTLVTRDARRYRYYFPRLRLQAP